MVLQLLATGPVCNAYNHVSIVQSIQTQGLNQNYPKSDSKFKQVLTQQADSPPGKTLGYYRQCTPSMHSQLYNIIAIIIYIKISYMHCIKPTECQVHIELRITAFLHDSFIVATAHKHLTMMCQLFGSKMSLFSKARTCISTCPSFRE